MRRIAISFEESLAGQFDTRIERRGYRNRSEAFRELSNRVGSFQHDRHDVCVPTMQVHLDHDHCLETAIFRNRYRDVLAFADATSAQSGVRHGNFHIVPADTDTPPACGHQHRYRHPTT